MFYLVVGVKGKRGSGSKSDNLSWLLDLQSAGNGRCQSEWERFSSKG